MVAIHTMELSLFWTHQVDHQMAHPVMSLLTHMMEVLLMNMMEHLLGAVLELTHEMVYSQENSKEQTATHTVMVEVHIVMH